jgi:glycosyltransferase involved in cell wall biosynthesis
LNPANRITFFLPNVIGGVSNVVANIIDGCPALRNNCTVVLYKERHDRRQPSTNKWNAEVIEFSYDSSNNFHHTATRLKKLLPGHENMIMVATDGFELDVIETLRWKNRVVFIVPGDFNHYYTLAKIHQGVIDVYITISASIFQKLKDRLPANRFKDMNVCYFPTPVVNHRTSANGQELRLIFSGRMEPAKNPLMIVEANRMLKEKGIPVSWTVVGDGPLKETLKEHAGQADNINMVGFVTNEELHHLYHRQDVLFFPSKIEGLPVTIIEAMKTGLVPVVSDIPGGIREVVMPGRSGFLCNPEDANTFVEKIDLLHYDRSLLARLSAAAIEFANSRFDLEKNSTRYYEVITGRETSKPGKTFVRVGSRLDRAWVHNGVVKMYRKLKRNMHASTQ